MASVRFTPFERVLQKHIQPLAPSYRVASRCLAHVDDGIAKCVYFDPSGYAKGWYRMYAVVRPLCIPGSHSILQLQLHVFNSLPRVEVDIATPGASPEDPGVREIAKRLPRFTAALDRIKGVSGTLKEADLWWGAGDFAVATFRSYLFAYLGDYGKSKKNIDHVLSVTAAMPKDQFDAYFEHSVLPARRLLEAINAGEAAVRTYLQEISDENLLKLKLTTT